MLTSNLVVYTKINLNVDIKTSVVLADSSLSDVHLILPTAQPNDQGNYNYIEVDIKKLSALNNIIIYPQNSWETIEGSSSYTLTSDNECIRIVYTNKGYKIVSANSSASGTVTSVAASAGTGISVSGSPITTSGTLAVSLSGTALPTTSGGTGLTSFTANGIMYASSTSALATGSALTFEIGRAHV